MAEIVVEIEPGEPVTEQEMELVRQIARRCPDKSVFSKDDFIEQRIINEIAKWLYERDGFVVSNEASMHLYRGEVECLLDRLHAENLWRPVYGTRGEYVAPSQGG